MGGMNRVAVVKTGEAEIDAWTPRRFKLVQKFSNRFESNSNSFNWFHSKKNLPEIEKIEIKYGFKGFDERDDFLYRHFSRFKLDFE
jgi:hypothetical protein